MNHTNPSVPGLVHCQIDAVDNLATGKACAEYRRACGLTGAELARRLGVSAAMITKLEQGARTWTIEFLTRYTACCGQPQNNEDSTRKA